MSGHRQKSDVEFLASFIALISRLLRATLPRFVAKQAERGDECNYSYDPSCGGRSKHCDYSLVRKKIV